MEMTFENLVKGKRNQEAVLLAEDISMNPEDRGIVVFAGPTGCGKTHLVHAMKNEIDKAGRDRTVFFTADLHLGHAKVIEYCQRPFADVTEMNEKVIENINKKVKADAELWVLGDFSFRISKEAVTELRKRIQCRHIHLVVGNHDRKDYVNEDDIFESIQQYKELKVEYEGSVIRVILFHYPIADWNGRAYGTPLFHGHIHSTGDYNRENMKLLADEACLFGHTSRVQNLAHRAYDVGVDANNYYPISLEEIMKQWNGGIADME